MVAGPALRLVALALTWALAGCADPQGEFEAFSEQLAKKPKPPAGACGPEVAREIEGTFFAALATQLAPETPTVLLATIETQADGMHVVLQPLRVADRETPVGDPIVAVPASIDESGAFSLVLKDIELDGAANPITPDPIEAAELLLEGTACDDFLCGDLSGQIQKPLPITLIAGKSQFAMQRVAEGADLPEPPPINCARDLADPL